MSTQPTLTRWSRLAGLTPARRRTPQSVARPVRFVARKSTFARPLVRSFYQAIRLHLADLQYVPAWTHGARLTGE